MSTQLQMSLQRDKRTSHVQSRFWELWNEVDPDPVEVTIVVALWWNTFTQLFSTSTALQHLYLNILVLCGRDLLIFTMSCLGVFGTLSCFLYLPTFRRSILCGIGCYYFVTGLLMFSELPFSESAGYHMLFAGVAGWAWLRLGKAKKYVVRSIRS